MSIFKKLFGKKEEAPKQEVKPQPEIKPVNKDAEISTAIAAAIYLYRQEVHDYEDTVLTIKRIDRAYSPWSSKIYSLRKYPRQI
ncbi:MAG: hypothetical protein EHM58_18405 [Ignavibacteriae bacterium]|nr:MAG: hypothetical protein EHM58_18405 [Ignavibacteriota bacterium]